MHFILISNMFKYQVVFTLYKKPLNVQEKGNAISKINQFHISTTSLNGWTNLIKFFCFLLNLMLGLTSRNNYLL